MMNPLTPLSELAQVCTIYGSGSAFHNLKHITNRTRSIYFALRDVRVVDVDQVTEDKWKVRLMLNDDHVKYINAFENNIKNTILDTKLGNTFMSSDLVEKITSAMQQPTNQFSTTLVRGACTIFTKSENENEAGPKEALFQDWRTLLRGGLNLEYVIIEPFKLWFLNDNGSITYRIRNMTIRTDHSARSKSYAFEDDD